MKDYSSIAISSRVKFSRNLSGFDFPSTLNEVNGNKVLNKSADTILRIDKNFKIYRLKTLPEIDKNIMKEKSLISELLLQNEDFSATILSDNEEISIMLNESDHIVETCTKNGLSLIAAYDELNNIDNEILTNVDVSFDDMFGFLTSNISSVGTGLSASINLFLPALTITEKIKSVFSEINNLGFEIQISSNGDFQSNDYVYKLENSQTIGRKETDYIVKLTEIAIKICEAEISARKELLTQNYVDDVKDMVYRAWGILSNCYKISVSEARKYLSDLKIGLVLDFVRFKEVGFIESLFVDIEPYSLTKISGLKVSAAELDKYRAKFLSNILKTKRIK